jgi:putative serine protease PepD
MRRLLNLRVSLFVTLIAVAVLTIALLRAGGSASQSDSTDFTAVATPVSTTTSATQVYNATKSGVVKITTGNGLGTGIVLDKNGDILTNDHVVDGANNLTVSFASKATRSATLVGADPSSDLAVIKVNPSGLNLQPLTLGDSSAAQVGDTVYALGNPFGYTDSFSEGIVSGLDRSITAPNGFTIAHAIQTDAAINPGNSGGPLLNANGQVIGINAQIATDSATATGQGQNNGVGFAIPINTAKTVVAQLEKSGHVSHAYLGVATSDASSQNGAVVQSVQPGSPADNAGIRQGDVIRSVDGKQLTGSSDLAAAISTHSPGDKVSLTIVRGGSTQSRTVTLGQQPGQAPGG